MISVTSLLVVGVVGEVFVHRSIHQSTDIGEAVGCWYSCTMPNWFDGVMTTLETISMGDTSLLSPSIGDDWSLLPATLDKLHGISFEASSGTSFEASSKTFQVGRRIRFDGRVSIVAETAMWCRTSWKTYVFSLYGNEYKSRTYQLKFLMLKLIVSIRLNLLTMSLSGVRPWCIQFFDVRGPIFPQLSRAFLSCGAVVAMFGEASLAYEELATCFTSAAFRCCTEIHSEPSIRMHARWEKPSRWGEQIVIHVLAVEPSVHHL